MSGRRVADGENRLPPAAAVVVALVIYALLPAVLQFVGRFVIPGIESLCWWPWLPPTLDG